MQVNRLCRPRHSVAGSPLRGLRSSVVDGGRRPVQVDGVKQREYDVAVLGGGPSGFCAALAASRAGARTLLVERLGFLGGTATASMVTPWMSFHGPRGPVVAGIAQEVVDRLIEAGACPGHLDDPLGVATTVTPFDTEQLILLLLLMAEEAGIDLLLNAFVSGTVAESHGLRGVQVVHKAGTETLRARRFIDSTGDADILHLAGQPTRRGREADGLNQPLTAIFKLGGVQEERLLDYIRGRPDQAVLAAAYRDGRPMPVLALSGLFEIVEEARRAGEFDVPRDRLLLFGLPRKGDVAVNTTRIFADPLDPWDSSRAACESARQIQTVHAFLRRWVPGFEECYLLQVPVQLGVRESRRAVGQYVLDGEDVRRGRDFPDSIARGAFPIDIHSPDGAGLNCDPGSVGPDYGIPFRCLVPRDLNNVLVTGRALSATFEAHASARITPTAMATGQAAGVAAALSLEEDVTFPDLDTEALRRRLQQDGAIV